MKGVCSCLNQDKLRISTNRAASPTLALALVWYCRPPATPPSMVLPRFHRLPMAGNAISHQHARSCCSLKHLVDSFNPQRRAFLIGPRANDAGHPLSLFPCHPRTRVVRRIGVIRRRSQISLATNKYDGNGRPTDISYFLNPLYGQG